MKISIDTKNDNSEDIKKAIKILQSLIEGQDQIEGNGYNGSEMMNMFNQSDESSQQDQKEEETSESELKIVEY